MGKILLVSFQRLTHLDMHHCDTKSCSDGISMIIAIMLFMYQVDYSKLQLSHPSPDDILLELCYNLWTWFYVCVCVCVFIILILFRYISYLSFSVL